MGKGKENEKEPVEGKAAEGSRARFFWLPAVTPTAPLPWNLQEACGQSRRGCSHSSGDPLAAATSSREPRGEGRAGQVHGLRCGHAGQGYAREQAWMSWRVSARSDGLRRSHSEAALLGGVRTWYTTSESKRAVPEKPGQKENQGLGRLAARVVERAAAAAVAATAAMQRSPDLGRLPVGHRQRCW